MDFILGLPRTSRACHPQTDGQTEMVNRTIGQLLRAILKKKLRQWEECLPHIEFAYNRAPHSTTSHSPFQVVYGFNPLTPFDLVPLPIDQALSKDASKKADFVKEIHAKVHEAIVNSNKKLVEKRNVGRRKVVFKPGDWVWVHFRKERFPQQRKSKLDDRGDGPFQILEKINDNAYKVDLPGHYNVSATFNVADLSLFDIGDRDSRTNPFQEGEDDVNRLDMQEHQGVVTRAKAKQLKSHKDQIEQEKFQGLNFDVNFDVQDFMGIKF
ncbi:hypothetical protein M9H77_02119 [Catharanthus roseus]|uniref:Uncharacterized protein n=1 Tax=Catharanthus roseus TaxID=4058 RepID=A0ACC0C7S9_CATRO|nr:hypothetical protein M9H77_02119 [Catharanthus roseus]